MTSNEYENDQELAEDAVDAEALARVEGFILEIAKRYHPESLSQLRTLLDQHPIEEPELLRTALWSLLNQDLLVLSTDRRLHVGG